MGKLFPGITRRKKRQQERRNSIIRAATQLLSKKGYDQTTMQDIAEAADLSASSVYYYFESKIAIIEEAINIFVAEATKIDVNPANSGSLREGLMSGFIERLDYFRDYNIIALLAEADRNPELRPQIQHLFQSLQQELRNRITLLQDAHLIEVDDADLVAEMILIMGFGALAISTLKKTEGETNIDVKKMLNAFNSLLFNQRHSSLTQEDL
jgi:AcrR family transcriptional regulator